MILDIFDIRLLLLYLLIFCPLEYLIPAHADKKIFRKGLMTDVMHFFFSGILIRIGLFAVVLFSLQLGNYCIPSNFREWISQLPLWFQIICVTIIADFGFYASHRLMHNIPFLWKFHAIHHSSEQLDWLAAFRVHPVDQVIVKGSSLLPVFALGFSSTSIAIAGLIYQWQGLLIHSNIKFNVPFLKWIIATPDFHHWHHSNEAHSYNKNYAGQLPFWDILFGTQNMQSQLPKVYGIEEKMPQGYIQQLLYPFPILRGRILSEAPRAKPK